jgi:hypothetical protein
MGASSSRIWSEICGIQSDDVRARVLQTVIMSPEHVADARGRGVYGTVLHWLSGYRGGSGVAFPYDAHGQPRAQVGIPVPTLQVHDVDTIQHVGGNERWSHMYAPAQQKPIASALVTTPATRARDEFHQSLDLLSIADDEVITPDRLKQAFKRTALQVHPDKGGSKEQFDAVRKAFQYVLKVLQRVNPAFIIKDDDRLTGAVTQERAAEHRKKGEVTVAKEPPVALSAKKLDVSMFNRLFEENRMPDASRDTGYGDWLKSKEPAVDERLKGKAGLDNFESVYREKVARGEMSIQKYVAPEYLVAQGGTVIDGMTDNFTSDFGSDMQFTDLKDAYTRGATIYQEVADVKVRERSVRSLKEAERMREEDMANVDPTESARFAAAEAAIKERMEKQRMRIAQQDVASEAWFDQMRGRLYVTNS